MKALIDVERLRSRAATLAKRAEADARAVDERRAAAEAYVRLAILDPNSEARSLLRRAVELDPYRADGWLLLARAEHAAGAYATALKHLGTASLLASKDPRVELYLARSQIRLAASTATASQAEGAFDALARTNPSWSPDALLTAIDATIHSSAKVMRERLPGLLATVPIAEARRTQVTRLLYLALASLAVGPKHDARNRDVLAAITDAVERYQKASLADQAMMGVTAAAAAKACSPEEICDRVDAFARDIPDVRVVRLLLRERLATVVDPTQRLTLFERAMEKIPSLDGIAHDYLQLRHLVAKRAVATGDFAAARESWASSLEVDADNLAVFENLRLLALRGGEGASAELDRRIGQLRRIYVQHSPRADLVLARVAAILLTAVEDRLTEFTSGGKKLELAAVPTLLYKLARAGAVGRAAHTTDRSILASPTLLDLLDPTVEDAVCFDGAVAILGQPLVDEMPAAYALVDTTKDASQEIVLEARAKRLEDLDRRLAREGNPFLEALRERVARETTVLLDPSSRALYDSITAPVELAETVRQYARIAGSLIDALQDSPADDPPARIALVGKVRQLLPDYVQPYMTVGRASERAFEDDLAIALCGPALEAADAAFGRGDVERAIDLLRPYVDSAANSVAFNIRMAVWITDDPRLSLDDAVRFGRHHARAAQRLNTINESIITLATESDSSYRQRVAADRAMMWNRREKPSRALVELAAAMPGDSRVRASERGAAGLPWAQARPTGRLRFALMVARSIRSSTIRWYNENHPYSQYELLDQRHSALICLRTAHLWAHYVVSLPASLTERDDDSDESDTLVGHAQDLLEQLEKDRHGVMGAGA